MPNNEGNTTPAQRIQAMTLAEAGIEKKIAAASAGIRDNGWSYDSQVRSDVFCHPDVRCFYLTANKTAYIYITKAFDQSEPRNRLLG